MRKTCTTVLSIAIVLLLESLFKFDVCAENINNNPIQNIDKVIEQYVDENIDTTAGMSVSVFDASNTIYTNHFGYLDVENKIPVTEETVMDWGSVSKLLVWISAMQLAEQGLIDLNTDINTYLPEGFLQNLSYDTPITMLNLMNHNAGFEESIIGMATGKEQRIISLEEYLLKVQPKQVFEPGTVCAYSNWGTTLAAYIVEQVSGIPYYDYVRKNIFEPLGMNDSSICADLSDNMDVKERRKELKIYTTNVSEITPNMSYIVMYPAGMCVSTIGDMQRFAQALLSEDTVLFNNKETYHELFSPSLYFEGTEVAKNYHGFWAIEAYGTHLIGHGGNTAGCSSYLLLDMENHIGMVIQTNQYGEQIYNIKMPELLFGQYNGTSSDYNGLAVAARTIFNGPLKLYRLLSVINVDSSESATSFDIRTTQQGIDKISCMYGDYLVIGLKDIIVDIIVIGLYLLSVLYCLINIITNLVKKLIAKIKGKKSKKTLDLWCGIGLLLPLLPGIIFALMIPTLFNFQQWSVFAYKAALFVVLLSAFAMCVHIFYSFLKTKKISINKSRKKYIHSINICMLLTIINIIYWNWGMFWMI